MDIKSCFEIDFNSIIDKKEFYTVYKGIDKTNKNQVIVKKFDFNNLLSNEFKDLIDKEINNIRIMNLSNNSLHYINHFIENNNLFIIYENYDDNLNSLLKSTKLSIYNIKDIISQLNNIFKLIFDKNISHLDIKPSNIFIKKENNNKIYLLSNYGFYSIQQKYLFNDNKEFAFIPPEIKLNSSKDLSKADLWSIGTLLYYLYFQGLPFKNEKEYLNFISNKNEKLNIKTNDQDLNNLIENLLISDISKRLSWSDYFNHKFFRNEFGRIYYDNYEIEYEGIFKDNKKYKGKEYDLYGNLEFEGEFNNQEERWNGKIKEYNEKNKLIFEGEYVNGNRVGKEYNNNELVFEGEYKNGIRWNGKGKEKNDLIIFKGKYRNGIRIGEEYYSNEKLKFEGDRNGKGVEYFYDKNEKDKPQILFKGEYRNNKRWNGKGKDTNIKNGNGEGIEYSIYGDLQFEGEYKNGDKFKGKEYKYGYNSTNIIYVDEYKENNIWIGKEYYNYNKNRVKFEGDYENRIKKKGKEYYENGVIKFEGEYKDGKKWKGIEYNQKGEIYFKGEYKEQQSIYSKNFWMGYIYANSKIIATYKNGNILNEYFNLENLKNGIIFDNGDNSGSGYGKEYIYDELIFEGEYINNCRIKGKEYENNNIIFEGEYRNNNNKWNGRFKYNKNNNFILDGEYRNGNEKYYLYVPFYRNKKDYSIIDIKINKDDETIYYGGNDFIIREFPKYNFNIEFLKYQIENDKLLNSLNRNKRNIEMFEYKFNIYVSYNNYPNLNILIDKFKVKLPNDLIYQIILKIRNIFEVFKKNNIFYDLNSENILYSDTVNINIYLDVDLYILKSHFYHKKPLLKEEDNNKFNYYAPELYNDIKIKNLSKANIWSLGILIYQMIFHEMPDINYQKKLNNDNLLHNLINKMLEIIPEKRISIDELDKETLIHQINILYDRNIKYDLMVKIMFVGETCVGNNSLANSFLSNIPYLGRIAIIGINFGYKSIYYNGLKIKLQVINGAGQERFFAINRTYINRADIIILTYDITNESSLERLIDKYNSIKEDNVNKIYGVCANKIDIIDRVDEYSEEKAKEFMLENNLDYYGRTSCKTYEGIEDMIYNLVDKCLTKNKDELKAKMMESEIKFGKKYKKRKNKDCIIF